MKKLFLFLAVVSLLCACQPKLTEKVCDSYPNGQPQSVQMLDKSGECVKEIKYFESGQVMMEGAMKDGQREGEWTAYYPDGRTQSVCDFKAGKLDGVNKVYWENGNLRWEGFFKNNVHCGKWKYYDEQGIFQQEVDYGE